jgi:hypothetical protein
MDKSKVSRSLSKKSPKKKSDGKSLEKSQSKSKESKQLNSSRQNDDKLSSKRDRMLSPDDQIVVEAQESDGWSAKDEKQGVNEPNELMEESGIDLTVQKSQDKSKRMKPKLVEQEDEQFPTKPPVGEDDPVTRKKNDLAGSGSISNSNLIPKMSEYIGRGRSIEPVGPSFNGEPPLMMPDSLMGSKPGQEGSLPNNEISKSIILPNPKKLDSFVKNPSRSLVMPTSNNESRGMIDSDPNYDSRRWQRQRENPGSAKRSTSKDRSFRVTTNQNQYSKQGSYNRLGRHNNTSGSREMTSQDPLGIGLGGTGFSNNLGGNHRFDTTNLLIQNDDLYENAEIITKPNPYELYNFTFPAGKSAKMAKIHNITAFNQDYLLDILARFKYDEPLPVIILSGGRDSGRGKFLAGIARTAFRTDAVIVDSGVATGMEYYCLRRGIKMVGVFPENEVAMPKVAHDKKMIPNELANGHSHMLMITDKNCTRYLNFS